MISTFQDKIENTFKKLKTTKRTSIPSKISYLLPSGNKVAMRPFTQNLIKDSNVISLLAKWRDKSNIWFPAQFPVTFEGTKKWSLEQLILKKDRILFLLQLKNNKEPFGHMGLYRFSYEEKSCEIDNVIRGEEDLHTKGAMTIGLEKFIEWTYKYLEVNRLYLQVFSDNERAIALYKKVGFKELQRRPLEKKVENGNVSWCEVPRLKKGMKIERFFVKMVHQKELTSEERNLTEIAKKVRKNILSMSFRVKSAHVGGALSCVEILVALYFKIMNIYPKNPNNAKRDRLVFSKAHDAKALYSVLAERGFFPKEVLEKYECDSGILPGHSTRNCVPGIEVSAGSLGHGLPMACGMAYAGKLDNKKFRVFTILSDGECNEGSTWEAILFAGHHKLDNLIAIVDYNKLQGFGFTKDILNLEPFSKKWEDFNWEAKEINGHDFKEIIGILQEVPFTRNKPTVIIAHTIKGLGGVPKHVNQISSQYKPPTEEEFKKIMNKSYL